MTSQAFDVDALARELNRQKPTKPLSKKFTRLRGLLSISCDLNAANATLMLLAEIASRREMDSSLGKAEGIIDAALAARIISLYARSTDVSSTQRCSFDPRRFYSSDQRTKHAGLIDLRNQAVAHFGSGSHSAGNWAGDRTWLLINHHTEEMSFRTHYERTNFRGSVIVELAELLPLCMEGLDIDLEKLRHSIFSDIDDHASAFASAIAAITPEIQPESVEGYVRSGFYIKSPEPKSPDFGET